MNYIAKLIVFGLLFAFTSCVPSLNPLYTERDLVYDNSLLGVWVDKESGETWAFSNGGKLEYKLLHTDEDGRYGEFSAKLVKIDGKLFLDIVPVKTGFPQSDFYQSYILTTHTFMHVERSESNVQIAALDARWLKDLLVDNPQAIGHQKINGEIVLTASSNELQKFLLANLTRKEAFSQPIELTRKKRSGD